MQVRDLQQLKRVQEQLLEEYKVQQEQAREAGPTRSAAEGAPSWIGRVSGVVSSDEELGPHLLVIKQSFANTPPTPSNAVSNARVYYPTPGRDVADYSEDEYVLLLRVDGAFLADKLA